MVDDRFLLEEPGNCVGGFIEAAKVDHFWVLEVDKIQGFQATAPP